MENNAISLFQSAPLLEIIIILLKSGTSCIAAETYETVNIWIYT